MPHPRLQQLWFGLAVLLLAIGVRGWWLASPAQVQPGSDGTMVALWLSTACIVLAWWRRSAAPDAFDARFMAPLALAATASLSMVPLVDTSGAATAAAMLASGLAVVPLGWLLAGLRVEAAGRRRAQAAVVTAAAVAVLLAFDVGASDDGMRVWRWLSVSATVAIPTAVAALDMLRGEQHVPLAAQQRLVRVLTLLAIGLAPALTGICLATTYWPTLLLPALAAVGTAALLVRFGLQPLARVASAATVQRDQVVAATEAERTRLASVLHDGPLADIALLIQRLDDRGDADGAVIARSIAAELRAIGSELRLPILDDLGAGPALEWLVGRLAQRSGAVVRLQQTTMQRPPAAVELAAYRVAQEALVNALTHGAAPISVSYHATAAGIALSVDDSGPGLDRDAVARAERAGRLGLPSMAQRAEAIGAHLVLAARPTGGTHVGLEWLALGRA